MNMDSPEVKQYVDALQDLKFNSKPHINTLTQIAHENVQFCKEIVSAIETRIRTAPTNEKLPALYLLDSIVKNIGLEYTTEFSKRLVQTFCQAMESTLDLETRNQYLRLLKTWPQYFPPEKISLIEQRIKHAAPVLPQPSHTRSIHVNPQLFKRQTAIPNKQLPPQLLQLLPQQYQPPALYNQPLQRSPFEQQAQPVQHQQLLYSSSALGTPHMVAQTAHFHHPLHAAATSTTLLQPSSLPLPHSQAPTMMMHPQPLPPQHQHQQHQYPSQQPPYMYGLHPPAALPLHADQMGHGSHQPQPLAESSDIMWLQRLLQQGATAQQPQSTAIPFHHVPPVHHQQPQPPQLHTVQPSGMPLRGHILTPAATIPQPPELVINPLEKTKEIGLHALYKAFPLQCINCGLRVPTKELLDQHMDRHFEVANQRSKNKVLSRKWYQLAENWIEHVDDTAIENPPSIFFNRTSTPAVAEEKAPALVDNDEHIPSDGALDQCPVCKERFEKFYSSERDEWLLKDTVHHPETRQVMHRSCVVQSSSPLLGEPSLINVSFVPKRERSPVVDAAAADNQSDAKRQRTQ